MVLLASSASNSDATAYVGTQLSPSLTPALVALCRARPADPVSWLAEYLLAHKPPPQVAAVPPVELLTRVLSTESRRAEPRVTAALVQLAAQFDATLLDLESVFKTPASIAVKFARFTSNLHSKRPELSREQVEAQILEMHTSRPGRPPDPIIVDAMRYTLVVPCARYAEAVRAVRAALSGPSYGFQQIDNKNFWHGEQLYRGINDVFVLPLINDVLPLAEGALAKELFFEVQLHTPESIILKHAIHPLMKQERDSATDEALKERVRAEMLAQVQACPVPDGALDLPKAVVRPPWWTAKS